MRTKGATILTTEKVYRSLREDIAMGRFSPGERLVTDQLAEMKKVSRTPIREAMRQLLHEGLVETVPNHGARVRKMSWAEITEIYEIREALEVLAVRSLAEKKPGPELIAQLQAACDARRRAETIIDLELADLQLHRQILHACGKQLIASILESRFILVTSFRLSRDMIARRIPEHDGQVDQEHEQMIAAIAAGDADRAGQIMQGHIHHAVEYMRQMARNDHQENAA